MYSRPQFLTAPCSLAAGASVEGRLEAGRTSRTSVIRTENEYYESRYPGTPEDLRRKRIHQAFPNQGIVISEYGYCVRTPDRPEGDARRIEILRLPTRGFRGTEYIAGLISFFCNDYQTHVGDKGSGGLQQRVHGVVDLLGACKPSYAVLREESSPIEAFDCTGSTDSVAIRVQTRESVPAYTPLSHEVRGTLYGDGNISVEECEAVLPALKLGESASVSLQCKEPESVLSWRNKADRSFSGEMS